MATLSVNLDSAFDGGTRPILGAGFNLEHALWSCAEFRGLFRSEILDPFMPGYCARGHRTSPAAPPEVAARDLNPAVYESVLSSAQYADSWRFLQRLNRAGVKIVLGIWGGPAQFTDDGTRRGVLLPSHYDDYVDYVTTRGRFHRATEHRCLGDDDRQRTGRRRRQSDSPGWAGLHCASACSAPGSRRRQTLRAGYCRRDRRAAVPTTSPG